jgi:hypothetical protein
LQSAKIPDMKSVIILILAAALLAGLYLSKPSEASFAAYLGAQNQPRQPQTMKDVGKEILGGSVGRAQASTLVYNDHFLWATEDVNGQTQYFGMFGHWWKKTLATSASAG